MSRADALESYRTLPLPATTEEHWRFTDLKGFDPDSFGQGQVSDTRTGPGKTMLELDVAGLATISENGVVVERVPEGVTFAPLTDDHERLYSLVGWDEKFAAHNAAVWQHGLLVIVPAGVELEKPLYVRVSAPFWRLLVVAEEGARFSLVEEYVSGEEGEAYSNAVVELFVEQAAKLEAAGIQVNEMWDSGVCNGATVRDPSGNSILLHRRYARYPDGTLP